MSQAPIHFQFEDSRSAEIALDTLAELGYHVHSVSHGGKPEIQLFVEQNDLTSALEIAQANGGTLLDTDRGGGEEASYSQAYELDRIRIPAHVVNEDWPETYYTSGSGSAEQEQDGAAAISEAFDPSGDDYDHFQAGVRL